jgi:hypothetical protein
LRRAYPAALESFIIDEGHQFICVSSSLMAVEFYKSSGYQKVLESGFYSEGNVWVQCEFLEKHLFCPTNSGRWHRQISKLYIFVIQPLGKWLESNPWGAFILGFILFKILSFLMNFLR